MKKIIYLLFLLPFTASAQMADTTAKRIETIELKLDKAGTEFHKMSNMKGAGLFIMAAGVVSTQVAGINQKVPIALTAAGSIVYVAGDFRIMRISKILKGKL